MIASKEGIIPHFVRSSFTHDILERKGSMKELKVFFDYECPYCKRGHEFLLAALQTHSDLSVSWHPCEAHPRPEEHPPHTDLCIQGYYFVREQGGDLMAYHQRLYDAVHTDKIDVEDPAVLADYVKDLVDPAAYLAALKAGTYKAVQEEGNRFAYEENQVWFLPAFRMDGKKLDAAGGVGVTKAQLEAFLKDA